MFIVAVLATARTWSATYSVNNTVPSASDVNNGSPTSPLRTISGGVAKAVAGDTVMVVDGSYLESIVITRSGTPGKPIVLRGDPSKSVCISATDTVSAFQKCSLSEARGNPNYSSIYRAELPKDRSWQTWDASLQNIKILQDNQPLKIARWPKSAWFPYGDLYTNADIAESGDSFSIIDPRLTFLKDALQGSILTVIDVSNGNSPFYRTVVSFDSATHRITSNRRFPDAIEPKTDLYYLENSVAFMTQPGEFAIDTFVSPNRLYLWLLNNTNPNSCVIMASKNSNAQPITWIGGVSNIVIDGFYISDAGGRLGIGSSYAGSNITITNCILARSSVFLVNQSYVTIQHCIQTGASENGIDISQCNNIDIIENEIFDNGSDGITVSYNSRNVRILRNYIHDQWAFSHPDGIQVYRNVYNITIDSNLLYNCGQGIMTQEMDTGRIINNMIVGTHGTGLVLGYGSAKNIEVRDNTIFYTGMSPFSTDAPNNVLVNNLIGFDFALARYGWKNATNLTEDYNLFIIGPTAVSAADTSGKGPHSRRSSNIIFKNGIAGMASMVTTNNVLGSTPSSLKFDGTGNFFKPNDFIEANFDGVIRKVTAASATSVSFTPPLNAVHPVGWDLLMNWKASSTYELDLRLSDNSDGFNSGINGTTIGSSIDMKAYRQCDFNGDGKRDLPVIPLSVYKTPYYIKDAVKSHPVTGTTLTKIFFSNNRLYVSPAPRDRNASLAIFQLNGRYVPLPVLNNGTGAMVADLKKFSRGVYVAVLSNGKNRYSQPITIH